VLELFHLPRDEDIRAEFADDTCFHVKHLKILRLSVTETYTASGHAVYVPHRGYAKHGSDRPDPGPHWCPRVCHLSGGCDHCLLDWLSSVLPTVHIRVGSAASGMPHL